MQPMSPLHRSLRKKMEKAILDYHMIQDGDRILIGVSGGADSMALLTLFQGRFLRVTNNFRMMVAVINLGFESWTPENEQILKKYLDSTGIPYKIVHTSISEHALDEKARKNPCFICSMYRRRKIYELAHTFGCSKIAYGHHRDDIIETLLINILYGRQVNTMRPMQEIFQGKMHIIRPLAYVDENLIKSFVSEQHLPVISKLCPVEDDTRRRKVKTLIRQFQMDEKNANIRKNIFKSLYHVHLDFPPP